MKIAKEIKKIYYQDIMPTVKKSNRILQETEENFYQIF